MQVGFAACHHWCLIRSVELVDSRFPALRLIMNRQSSEQAWIGRLPLGF
jgi:hypothetical protein